MLDPSVADGTFRRDDGLPSGSSRAGARARPARTRHPRLRTRVVEGNHAQGARRPRAVRPVERALSSGARRPPRPAGSPRLRPHARAQAPPDAGDSQAQALRPAARVRDLSTPEDPVAATEGERT